MCVYCENVAFMLSSCDQRLLFWSVCLCVSRVIVFKLLASIITIVCVLCLGLFDFIGWHGNDTLLFTLVTEVTLTTLNLYTHCRLGVCVCLVLDKALKLRAFVSLVACVHMFDRMTATMCNPLI